LRPPEHRADLAGRSGSGSTAAPSGIDEQFRGYAELWAGVLRGYGVDAWVGAAPGEYCPGAYSVNVGSVA
jgi:hypothetical protein